MEKNENKAALYELYTSEGRKIESQISKLKGEYIPNIPKHIQDKINKKKNDLIFWENKVKELYQ